MKLVVLPFSEHQRLAVNSAIEMSHWCKGHGLVLDRDYGWCFMADSREIHFMFYNDSESYATLFALTWTGYEIQK